ncbi:MAG: isoprenylcysteine carboxylmethyltransferase family protein [Vicinamibacterales bacterium]|nr:isoprenylcysteine carboxylmethyltransferase family protein [Vicinamibacterales bacterium]
MTITRLLARWRVTLGFVCGALVLWLASPTWPMLAAGAFVAAVGEAIRVWAAGHLEKSREVTSSGPYRFTRHPLYLGSSFIGAGMAIASANVWVAGLAALYLGTTITAAMRAEEAHLREKFGDAYDAYAERRVAPDTRAWSWARAVYNREHHTMVGVAVGLGLLAVKAAIGN